MRACRAPVTAGLAPWAVAANAPSARSRSSSPSPSSRSPSLTSISAAECPRPSAPPPASSHIEEQQQCESVLAKILELEELDTNMYRGVSPEVPRWGRIFGGQTVAQALVACCRTVDPRFIVHSLHSYFLRPGDDDLPIIYYVERLRNGSSFASRRVTALQRGVAIFAMMVSFQTAERGVEHQAAMPPVPSPESIQSLMESYKDVLKDPRVPPRIKKGLERSVQLPFPVDLRRCVPENLEKRLQKNPPIQRSWMRVQGQLGSSLMLHQCALAYMSDWSLLETALLPHGLHGWIQRDDDSTLQMASIDHSMWFHHAFRADEWLLYDMESPAASSGRGLAIGRFYTRDGQLVVTAAQEGLIRVRSASKDRERRAAAKQAKSNTHSAAGTAATTNAAAPAAAAPAAAPSLSKKGTDADGPTLTSGPASFTPVSRPVPSDVPLQLPSKL